MKQTEIELLFRYNDWANDRILGSAEKLTPSQLRAPNDQGWGSLLGALVHLLDAEYAWRTLLQEGWRVEEMSPQDFNDLESVRARWQDERQAFWAYLRGLSDDDLRGAISYDVGDETRFRVLWHCLVHVVNHGTQHRSECAAILTGFGQSPGDMDLLVYINSRGRPL